MEWKADSPDVIECGLGCAMEGAITLQLEVARVEAEAIVLVRSEAQSLGGHVLEREQKLTIAMEQQRHIGARERDYK